MNLLTFDTEEWYLEKAYHQNSPERYRAFDRYLKSILDLLEVQNVKATFFCVGGLATHFPEVVKSIADKGHEIGCHSNTHVWLSTLDRNALKADTETAIKALEDVTGKKVLSYRAPAFSIGTQNSWALEVLAECGIERDASVFPAAHNFGGFSSFPIDEPCVLKVGDRTIKEFPVCLTQLAGKSLAYSGGGYFRFFPLAYIKNRIKKSDYAMTYFHIDDLMHYKLSLPSKEFIESYFKVKPTMGRRVSRMLKNSIGTRNAFNKMCKLVKSFDYVNLEAADALIDWTLVPVVSI